MERQWTSQSIVLIMVFSVQVPVVALHLTWDKVELLTLPHEAKIRPLTLPL